MGKQDLEKHLTNEQQSEQTMLTQPSIISRHFDSDSRKLRDDGR